MPISATNAALETVRATNYSFIVPSEEGASASQSGSVGPQGTNANAAITGTGSVGATAVAGPGEASTSTTDNGATTTGSTATGGAMAPSSVPALTFGQVNSQSTGTTAAAPDAFQFRTPTAEQSGAVTPGSSTANSAVAGSGPVSAVSVAGPGSAATSTTEGGQTTANTAGAGGTSTSSTPSVTLPTFTRTQAPQAEPAPASEVYVARVGTNTAGSAESQTCTSPPALLTMDMPGQA